jgi:uncharacterized protein (TIRG00374 family)
MHIAAKRFARGALTLAVAGVLVALARTVHWSEIWRATRAASPALLLIAALLNLGSLVVRAVRWWIFLRVLGVGFPVALRATIVGAALDNVLVTQGGDAVRVLLVARATRLRRSAVLATVALERLFDPVCFGVLFFALTLTSALPPELAPFRYIAIVTFAVMVFVVAVLTRQSRRGMMSPVPQRPNAQTWLERLTAWLRHLRADVRELATAPRMVVALLLALAGWAMQLLLFGLVARAAHIAMPGSAQAAALLTTNAGLLLRATPGNLGVFQVVYALTAARFGVPTSDAVAVALLIQVVQIAPLFVLALGLAPALVLHPPPRDALEAAPSE